MITEDAPAPLRLALPKGRLTNGVTELLRAAGVEVRLPDRGYRPELSLPGVQAKLLKPQDVAQMLAAGARDVGFTGLDWIRELGADVVEVLDTGLDPVQIVAAAPRDGEALAAGRTLRVASEYPALSRAWAGERGLGAEVLRTFGSTEAFAPDDADVIVDNTSTGTTLRQNGLAVVDVLLRSTTRLFASREAWQDPRRRAGIDELALLLRSVLDARDRALVEVNVDEGDLAGLVAELPAMRAPTIAPLHGGSGFSVRAAVPRRDLARLIPRLRSRGGRDLLVSSPAQLLP